MKRKPPQEQLSLWNAIEDTAPAPGTESTEPYQDEPPAPSASTSQDTALFLDNELWERCQRQSLHLKERDIAFLRAWLLLWGKRNGYPPLMFPFAPVGTGDHRQGLIFAGVERWEADIQVRGLSGHYAGEWLVKCIEQLRRYDNGEQPMPWKELSRKSTEPRQDDETAIPNDDTEQALDLTTYSRDNLAYQGAHDQARRAWLREWTERQGYKAFHYTTHGKYSGYYQSGVANGQEGWTSFLEKAVQFDVYCCFIAALKQHPLKHHLEDAARRGEIHDLNDGLIWRPTNHKTPR